MPSCRSSFLPYVPSLFLHASDRPSFDQSDVIDLFLLGPSYEAVDLFEPLVCHDPRTYRVSVSWAGVSFPAELASLTNYTFISLLILSIILNTQLMKHILIL